MNRGSQPAGVLPIRAQTPGLVDPAVTDANAATTVCRGAAYTSTVRPPQSYTAALKVQQIASYHYADRRTADYEEDHLVPLEVGGAPKDPRNLWPQPHAVTAADGHPAGSREKDAFEDYENFLLCHARASRRITLAQAQRPFLTDWYAAYVAAGRPADPYHHQPAPSPSASSTH